MSVETQNKIYVSAPEKTSRDTLQVSGGNREWLKRSGIVADSDQPYRATPRDPVFSVSIFKKYFRKPLFFVSTFLICLLPIVFFQQQNYLMNEINFERSRWQSLNAANQHLQENLAQLSGVNLVQQSEMSRMGRQLQGTTQRFRYEIKGLEKSAAMSDALQHIFETEIGRMSARYDLAVDVLRKQVSEKNQMISSLQTSLQSMDGVVVEANRPSDAGGMTNGVISAVNEEFQFVIVSVGGVKGAQLGQMVELYHQGTLVGYGEVEKIYPEFSGVKVFSMNVLMQLKKGDEAFLRPSPVAF